MSFSDFTRIKNEIILQERSKKPALNPVLTADELGSTPTITFLSFSSAFIGGGLRLRNTPKTLRVVSRLAAGQHRLYVAGRRSSDQIAAGPERVHARFFRAASGFNDLSRVALPQHRRRIEISEKQRVL